MLLAFVAALLGVAFVEGHYARIADRMFRPPRKPVTAADAERARAAFPEVEEVSFRSSDGLLLRGYYVPSHNGAAIILGHGFENNRMQLLPEAVILERQGYGALMMDWRAHGASEGDVSTWGDREQDDVRAAVDFLASRSDVHAGAIGALGFSVGASAVAMAAAADPRIKAVVLEAVFTSFDEEMTRKMGSKGFLSLWPTWAVARLRGVHAERLRPVDSVPGIAPRPVLFVTGTADEDTPPEVVERVFARAAEPKQLLVVHTGHGGYAAAEPERYEKALVGFFDSTLLR